MTLHIVNNLVFTANDVLASIQTPVFKDVRGAPHALAVEAEERRSSGPAATRSA
ncbi:hypothetical protein GKZ68_03835 [Hymenobacter sp. BRD128]|uniref:hypothetical protein n=1 Tax=Hymenobacter sp. BRD128 TaxID=2675878 RepID=UPI00156451D3|nr:hypothetical protein [Hymenobacter sp. BRD128]QKG55846.1 hypothetical protein GKZ68_03835 [Hymenobacter sp. BRD128]